MTPVLQPFLSEMPMEVKPCRAPMGAFAVARIGRNTSAPWSPSLGRKGLESAERLPKGVVAGPRRQPDMSRHATVILA